MKIYTILLSLIFVCATMFGQTENVELFAKTDQMQISMEFKNALETLNNHAENYSDEPEFLWRLAEAYYNVGDQMPDDKEFQKKYFYPGLENAKKCIELNPKSAKGHQFYAILIGTIGELEGTKQKIINSYELKKHAMIAIELDPLNDTNYHLMGRWHYGISELSWIERKVANLIYSKVPEGSFEEAVEYFEKAHEIEPTYLRHILWLGKSLKEIGKKNESKKIWQKALAINAVSDSEKTIKKEIEKYLQ